MHFNIGPFEYAVRRQWSLMLDGEPIDGYCASTIRCIFLDGELDDIALETTLRHEHEHAWEFEVGTPRTPEDRANFLATVSTSFDRQFAAQGGLAALKEIAIEGLPPQKSGKTQKISDWTINGSVCCGRCGAEIRAGSVYRSEPVEMQANVSLMECGCQCPMCDTVQAWTERATPDGLPTGEYIRARMLEGAEAVQWLDEHREVHAPHNDF